MKRLFYIITVLVIIFGGRSSLVFGMDSTNYRVAPDVLDESGGVSNDGTYRLYNNLGESAVTGESASTNYKIFQGFLQPDALNLYLTISNPTISFGTISNLAVSSQNTIVTLGTNSNKGYSLTAYDNTSPGIANGLIDGTNKIADATTPNIFVNLPLAGVEHYGITVTGTHADAGYAGGTKINSFDNATWVNIGSYNNLTRNDSFIVNYRAGAAEDTPYSNNYSAITTFILTVNY